MMSTLIPFAAALLPAIVLLFYIWKKDKQKEPTSWLVKAVLWGAAICIPVAVVEMGISTALFGAGGKLCVKMHKVARKKVLALLHHDEVDVNSTESIHV